MTRPRRSTAERLSRSPVRVAWMSVGLAMAFGGIATRLVILQVVQAPAYAKLAMDQRARTIEFPARRGAIFDRNGHPLAISIDLETIYADPQLVEDPAGEAAKLARVLDRPATDLEAALRGRSEDSRFEYVARQVEPRVARRVARLDLPGIYARPEAKRYYPGGSLASHVVGGTDTDGKGIAGIELQFDSILRGKPGRIQREQDPSGRLELPQADSVYEDAVPGRSIFLTIDKEIQYFTSQVLADAVKEYDASAGSALVVEAGTGDILALANVPEYDLNDAGAADAAALRNRALTDVYEPGSAFKIVTASAALEEGTVSPHTKFEVPDSLPYLDRVFHDSHAHATEEMTVTEIIEQSSNVGTIKIGLALGGRLLDEYVRAFGFGSETGLDFPGESPGIVLDRDDWSGTTVATIPIGQGIAVTPLQMAAAYGCLANGGICVEPKLVTGMLDEQGRLRASPDAGRRRIVSPRTARAMTGILMGVTRAGTGIAAQVPGYAVAGKTGTAQKPLPEGGYGNSYVASFAGYAPARHPEVIVLVVLDDPTPIWGGSTAAPTFATITEFALRHLGVVPTLDPDATRRSHEARAGTSPAYD